MILDKNSINNRKLENFNRKPNRNSTIVQKRSSHHDIDIREFRSPLLLNTNAGNLNQMHSDISDSFTNDENSKSTLFTNSIDEANAKLPTSLNKHNPMSIYYC